MVNGYTIASLRKRNWERTSLKAYHFTPIKHTIEAQHHSFIVCQPRWRDIKLFVVPDPANKVPKPALFSDVIVARWNWHRQHISTLKKKETKIEQLVNFCW